MTSSTDNRQAGAQAFEPKSDEEKLDAFDLLAQLLDGMQDQDDLLEAIRELEVEGTDDPQTEASEK